MSSLPHPSSSLWCSPCLHTMNTLASALQNQLSSCEDGKSNLMAVTRRGDCFSSQWQKGKHIVPAFYWREKKQLVKRGKLLGCSSWTVSLPQVKSHLFPSIFNLSLCVHSLSTPLPAHFDTTYQSPSDTRDHIPLSSLPDETEQ